ncbi:MAG: MotA/TolQ/ExbB proton channel family protein [Treponema sp.]|nr:MotA/TolQ/ExbB proton channel family protein [Treponema sp.]
MNILSLAGFFGIFAAIIISILWGGNPITAYLDIPSFFVVVVASVCMVIFAGIKPSDSLGMIKLFSLSIKKHNFGELEIAKMLMGFSEKARREGLLALEDDITDIDNELLKTGLRLTVDGTDGAIIRNLLEIEINKIQERHARGQKSFDLWAAVAPASGMWGTVVGLVGMMKNLDDPSSVGPNMALALITTLYGSVVANALAIPTARRLRVLDAEEANVIEMIIEGVLSIQAGDNTRILCQKFLAYMSKEDSNALRAEFLKD